ncbi:YbaK/EbsC family protein [Cupriavidus basilensis]
MIKTLVMEDEKAQPLIVLMHGDCSVSTKTSLGRRGARACSRASQRWRSGIADVMGGGTSPFGTRKRMPVYVGGWCAGAGRIYIVGAQGYLVSVDPQVLTVLVGAEVVGVRWWIKE